MPVSRTPGPTCAIRQPVDIRDGFSGRSQGAHLSPTGTEEHGNEHLEPLGSGDKESSEIGETAEHWGHIAHKTHLWAETAEHLSHYAHSSMHYVHELDSARKYLKTSAQVAHDLRRMKRTVNTLERMATQGGQVGEKARASLDDAKAAYESAKSLYADEKLARAAANEFVALSKSVESTSKGVAMIKLGRAATGLETALSGSKLGRGLMATGRITASQGFARGLVVAGAVLEGVVSYTDSPAQTVAGKVSNAALGAGGGALVMVNPVVAVGDLVAPKGYTLSEIYRGGATAISSIAEGFATGNTSAMDKFHRRSLNGDYGAVMQAASEAGEYWTEKGITGGLKEFAQSVQWWLSP